MILKTITVQSNTTNFMCAVCVSERSGAQIALLVIIASLVLLAILNWSWKKYFKKNKDISTQK